MLSTADSQAVIRLLWRRRTETKNISKRGNSTLNLGDETLDNSDNFEEILKIPFGEISGQTLDGRKDASDASFKLGDQASERIVDLSNNLVGNLIGVDKVG